MGWKYLAVRLVWNCLWLFLMYHVSPFWPNFYIMTIPEILPHLDRLAWSWTFCCWTVKNLWVPYVLYCIALACLWNVLPGTRKSNPHVWLSADHLVWVSFSSVQLRWYRVPWEKHIIVRCTPSVRRFPWCDSHLWLQRYKGSFIGLCCRCCLLSVRKRAATCSRSILLRLSATSQLVISPSKTRIARTGKYCRYSLWMWMVQWMWVGTVFIAVWMWMIEWMWVGIFFIALLDGELLHGITTTKQKYS